MNEKESRVLKDLASEAKKLGEAYNSTTGYTPTNPNPLVKRLLRLVDEAELLMETEDE
jgi:hypothetical protein